MTSYRPTPQPVYPLSHADARRWLETLSHGGLTTWEAQRFLGGLVPPEQKEQARALASHFIQALTSGRDPLTTLNDLADRHGITPLLVKEYPDVLSRLRALGPR